MVADFYVFLDNDRAGKDAIGNAIRLGLLLPNEYMLTSYTDMITNINRESEMEDMLDVEVYRKEIESSYGVSMTNGKFKARNKKWSDRIKDVFNDEGKILDEGIMSEIKLKVAQQVAANPSKALRPEDDVFLNKLIG